MPCTNPIDAYIPQSGGRPVFTEPRDFPYKKKLQLPCGECKSCALDYARDWGARAIHESKLHENNYFITLTYSPEHLPIIDGQENLVYKDFQNFMHRLRKRYPHCANRYLVCGEYGSIKGRPHWHLILFGAPVFDDLEFVGKGSKGDDTYTSNKLSEIWGKGFVNVGEVTPQTTRYVANYSLKNAFDQRWYEYEKDENGQYVLDENGRRKDWYVVDYKNDEKIRRYRPMLRSSKSPAIGVGYIQKYLSDFFPSGEMVVKGKKYPLPMAYLKWYGKQGDEEAEVVANLLAKREVLAKSPEHKKNSTPERRKVRQQVREARMELAGNGGKIYPKYKNDEPVSAAQLQRQFNKTGA